MGSIRDLTGQSFGRLTVIERVGKDRHGNIEWLCQCCCSDKIQVPVSTAKLRSGNTRSCGCLRRESASQMQSKNLVGQTFGALTVVEQSGKMKSGKITWSCQCSCNYGRRHIVSTDNLISGNVTQCPQCRLRQISQKLSKGKGPVRRARRTAVIRHGFTMREMARAVAESSGTDCTLKTVEYAESRGWTFSKHEHQIAFDRLFGYKTAAAQSIRVNELSPEVVALFAPTQKVKRERRQLSPSQVAEKVLKES